MSEIVKETTEFRLTVADPSTDLPQFRSLSYRMFVYMFTPPVADIILKHHHFKNRPIRPLDLAKYTDDMINGRWLRAGKTIKFTPEGMMIDGQHRLLACVNSGCSFEQGVAVGCPEEALEKIDQPGQARTIAQTLQIMGLAGTEAAVVASAIKIVKMYDEKTLHRTRGQWVMDTSYAVAFLRNNQILNELALRSHQKAFRHIVEPSVAAAMWFIFHRINPEKAFEFFTRLGRSDAPDGHPIHVAYLRLGKMKYQNAIAKRHREWDTIDQFAVMIHAWNNFIKGTTVTALQTCKTDDEGQKVLPDITLKSYMRLT